MNHFPSVSSIIWTDGARARLHIPRTKMRSSVAKPFSRAPPPTVIDELIRSSAGRGGGRGWINERSHPDRSSRARRGTLRVSARDGERRLETILLSAFQTSRHLDNSNRHFCKSSVRLGQRRRDALSSTTRDLTIGIIFLLT